MMKKTVYLFFILVLYHCTEKPKEYSENQIVPFADSLFQVNVDQAKIAGAAVIIEHRDTIILDKSYGFANLEFDIPMPANASFEIGSVTKQFTAVAILKLVAEGKISLNDDFTRYVDFDTQGRKVTVDQLLNHTSGIPGFTELPHFRKLAMYSYDRDSLIRFVEKEDFLFEPGEEMIYNNTAYFILGLIIERVSGKPYEDYLREQIFDPLGMSNTYYSSNSKVVKNKAYGYQYTSDGLTQRPYLDHTWPYAAGSLASTTSDLLTWMKSLHRGKMLSDEYYKQLITPKKLNDGSQLRYAMGLSHFNDHGHEVISHGGGINGFLSETRYYPNEDLYIICLVNTTGPQGAGYFANQLVWKILDNEPPITQSLDIDLKAVEGAYTGQARGQKITYKISVSKDNGIIMDIENSRQKDTLYTYIGESTWMNGNSIIKFKDNELRIDQISGYYILVRQ